MKYSFLWYHQVVSYAGSFAISSFSSKFIIASFDMQTKPIKTSLKMKTIIINLKETIK